MMYRMMKGAPARWGTAARAIFAALLAAVSLSSSCSLGRAVAAPKRPPAPTPMTAEASKPTLTFTDPRTGKRIWSATAQSLDAQSGAGGSSVVGTMHGVNGALYRGGVAVDSLAAQTVTADQAKRIVIATGRVRVQSLSDRSTNVECDRLVWRSDGDSVVGTGHVVFRRGGFTQTGLSFQADTKLRTLVMPATGAGGGYVRATLNLAAKSRAR